MKKSIEYIPTEERFNHLQSSNTKFMKRRLSFGIKNSKSIKKKF